MTALKLHRHCPDKEELSQLLSDATTNCGREVEFREIESAIRDSRRVIEAPTEGIRPVRRWPERNEERIEAVVCSGPNLAELAASSPVRWTDDAPHTEKIIDAPFPGNPLLCAGPKQSYSPTRSREEWRGFLEKQQFIVPNPMTARFGKTQSGTMSPRTLANTGPRRFLVVEFDTGTFDHHAAALKHLGKCAPLVLVVHSANKSLHGWYYCAGEPEAAVEKFFRYAVTLGADPATWTRCQLVRCPYGLRDNGKLQRVVYFDPRGVTG